MVKFPTPKVNWRKRVAEVSVALPSEDSLQEPGSKATFHVELKTPQGKGGSNLTGFWCLFDPEIGELDWTKGGAGGAGVDEARELRDYNLVGKALAGVFQLWAKRQLGELPTHFSCKMDFRDDTYPLVLEEAK